MQLADFSFELPQELIAQAPVEPRDAARLLVIRPEGLVDSAVRRLPELLSAGDILVANDTRVIPAELEGRRGQARVGITLDQPMPDGTWSALARNARRLHAGDLIEFARGLTATVVFRAADGSVVLRFAGPEPTSAARLKLPPYISRPHGPTAADAVNYQTIFAARPGAVAAPTAGLHFTAELLAALAARGVRTARITLHVGAGTFLPLRKETLDDVRLHAERGLISPETARAINEARAAGGRILAVGTTTLRLLESAAAASGEVTPFAGETNLFLRPGHRFRTAELLLTNFHLPRSSLFVLVAAFAGRERMLTAYRHAIAARYRFYSYGDACLIARGREG
ncbi:MAG: tRNA preQ1(34) S-adenosylmethionine ribosyltransferase-isomerase QueA [Acetobacteraceae bacterium]